MTGILRMSSTCTEPEEQRRNELRRFKAGSEAEEPTVQLQLGAGHLLDGLDAIGDLPGTRI